MSASKPQRKRTVLTEDGELRDEISVDGVEISAQTAPLFCIHCGSPNRSEAHFCRKCGQPLDDQDVDPSIAANYVPSTGDKRKHSKEERGEQPATTPFAALMSPQMALVQVFTLIFVALGVVFSLIFGAPLLAAGVLFAWFMVEAAWSGALK